jgi:hypothetical protein
MFRTNGTTSQKHVTAIGLWLALACGTPRLLHGESFTIPDGDVAGLIAAINTANSNGESNTINLAPGGTYTLTAVNNDVVGNNGLPRIAGRLTINGNGATIQGDFGNFRILFVAATPFGPQTELTLDEVTIRRGNLNSSAGYFGSGAGLMMFGGTVLLRNSTITENSGNFGGGIGNFGGTLIIENSTISVNQAGRSGGGIFNVSTVGEATTVIGSSTLFENRAQEDGDQLGFFLRFPFEGAIIIKNSVLASPTRRGHADCSHNGDPVITSGGYNIVRDASCGFSGIGDTISPDPLLGPTIDNVGSTPTYSPLNNSPAIDAVPLAYCTDVFGLPLTTDQRGIPRPQGPACDIGSVEVVQPLYHVCLLYDATNGRHSGSTMPIKLQLCDSAGNDLSSQDITVHAVSISQTATWISGAIQGSGNANSDNDFRFDSALGSTGGYIFNLSTNGLVAGTYQVNFMASGDFFIYAAPFQVK